MPASAEEALPKWARIIRDEVVSSNRKNCAIAYRSEGVAEQFSDLDSSLEGHGFHESLLSRMKRAKLKSPRYEKVVVLKLVLLTYADPACRKLDSRRRQEVLEEAQSFARRVMDAHKEEVHIAGLGNVHDRRRVRTVELLDGYGAELLRKVDGGEGAGKPEAKLALLHRLGGNVDDARYWEGCAASLDGSYSNPQAERGLHGLLEKAREYAAEYQRKSNVGVACLYLRLAVENGDGMASFRLGQMAELKGDLEEAEKMYRRSRELGYKGGSGFLIEA